MNTGTVTTQAETTTQTGSKSKPSQTPSNASTLGNARAHAKGSPDGQSTTHGGSSLGFGKSAAKSTGSDGSNRSAPTRQQDAREKAYQSYMAYGGRTESYRKESAEAYTPKQSLPSAKPSPTDASTMQPQAKTGTCWSWAGGSQTTQSVPSDATSDVQGVLAADRMSHDQSHLKTPAKGSDGSVQLSYGVSAHALIGGSLALQRVADTRGNCATVAEVCFTAGPGAGVALSAGPGISNQTVPTEVQTKAGLYANAAMPGLEGSAAISTDFNGGWEAAASAGMGGGIGGSFGVMGCFSIPISRTND